MCAWRIKNWVGVEPAIFAVKRTSKSHYTTIHDTHVRTYTHVHINMPKHTHTLDINCHIYIHTHRNTYTYTYNNTPYTGTHTYTQLHDNVFQKYVKTIHSHISPIRSFCSTNTHTSTNKYTHPIRKLAEWRWEPRGREIRDLWEIRGNGRRGT